MASSILARRLNDNRIDIIIQNLEHYWDDDSDETSEVSTDTISRSYEDVCTVLEGSDFYLLPMKEEYDLWAPTLIYISTDGKMEMIRVEPWRDMEDRNFTRRNIFEPGCFQVAASYYFDNVNHVTEIIYPMRLAVDEDSDIECHSSIKTASNYRWTVGNRY